MHTEIQSIFNIDNDRCPQDHYLTRLAPVYSCAMLLFDNTASQLLICHEGQKSQRGTYEENCSEGQKFSKADRDARHKEGHKSNRGTRNICHKEVHETEVTKRYTRDRSHKGVHMRQKSQRGT